MKINVTAIGAKSGAQATVPDDAVVLGVLAEHREGYSYIYWTQMEGSDSCEHSANIDSFLDDVDELVAWSVHFALVCDEDIDQELVQRISIASTELRS